MLRLLRSVLNSVGTAIREDPEVVRLLAAYPRLARFISDRLSPREPFGLRLTVGVALGWIFLSLFFGVLRALLEQEPLVLADLRVLSLVQLFRSPSLDRVMSFITYLGNWEIVGSGIVLLNVYLFLSRRFGWLAALNVSWLGGEAFVWAAKTLVGRARPDLITALVPAHGPSFPSGHAFVAFSFYGLVAWFVIKAASTKWWEILVAIVAMFVMLAIGFSRIYLGVHWPTDVLASLAAGAAWLTIIITALIVGPAQAAAGISSWAHTSQGRIVGGMLLLAWVGIVIGFYETHPLTAPAGKAPQAPVALQEGDIPTTLFSYVPRFSEDILGRPQEPINVILIGGDADLRRAFQAAGWLPAPSRSPARGACLLPNCSDALIRGLLGFPSSGTHDPTPSALNALHQPIPRRSGIISISGTRNFRSADGPSGSGRSTSTRRATLRPACLFQFTRSTRLSIRSARACDPVWRLRRVSIMLATQILPNRCWARMHSTARSSLMATPSSSA